MNNIFQFVSKIGIGLPDDIETKISDMITYHVNLLKITIEVRSDGVTDTLYYLCYQNYFDSESLYSIIPIKISLHYNATYFPIINIQTKRIATTDLEGKLLILYHDKSFSYLYKINEMNDYYKSIYQSTDDVDICVHIRKYHNYYNYVYLGRVEIDDDELMRFIIKKMSRCSRS